MSIQEHSMAGAQPLTPGEVKLILKSFTGATRSGTVPCSCLAWQAITRVPAWRIWREAHQANATERRLGVPCDSENICCRDG